MKTKNRGKNYIVSYINELKHLLLFEYCRRVVLSKELKTIKAQLQLCVSLLGIN